MKFSRLMVVTTLASFLSGCYSDYELQLVTLDGPKDLLNDMPKSQNILVLTAEREDYEPVLVSSDILEINKDRIGLVDADLLMDIRLDNLDIMRDAIQQEINGLVDLGVNKVIVRAKMEDLAIQRQLSKSLHDADIIVSRGLANKYYELQAGAVAMTPDLLRLEDADAAPLIIVNTKRGTAIERLVVDFDIFGHIINSSLGKPCISL